MIIKCDNCSKEFYKKPSHIARAKNHFCCTECHNVYRHNKTIEQFNKQFGGDFKGWLTEKYVIEMLSVRQISKILYGKETVSTCVRDWLTEFNIPIRHGSDAIKTQWINAEERRQMTSKRAKENLHSEEVRYKIHKTQQTKRYRRVMKDGRMGTANPYYKHGLTGTRLYRIWRGMKRRCNDINNKDYNHYGGRGINICDEWKNDFQAFYDWVINNGYLDDLTIDRVNYEPGNCRWATAKEQRNNQRRK